MGTGAACVGLLLDGSVCLLAVDCIDLDGLRTCNCAFLRALSRRDSDESAALAPAALAESGCCCCCKSLLPMSMALLRWVRIRARTCFTRSSIPCSLRCCGCEEDNDGAKDDRDGNASCADADRSGDAAAEEDKDDEGSGAVGLVDRFRSG